MAAHIVVVQNDLDFPISVNHARKAWRRFIRNVIEDPIKALGALGFTRNVIRVYHISLCLVIVTREGDHWWKYELVPDVEVDEGICRQWGVKGWAYRVASLNRNPEQFNALPFGVAL